MPRTKAVVASNARGGGAGRSNNPPRSAAANKNYSGLDEEDDEMDVDEFDEGDTTLVNEEDEEEEESQGTSTQDLKNIISAFNKSRSKKDKAEAAKAEKQMKDALQKGQDEVNSLIADHFKQRNALIAALQLDNNRPLSRIEPKGYQGAFSEQLTLTRQLVSVIDGYKKQLDPANEEFFDAAKHALQARPQQAKRAYKKLIKTSNAIVEERQAMAELHQSAAQEAYRHFKALTSL